MKLILTNLHYIGDFVQNRSTTISVTSKKRKKVDQDNQIICKDAHEAIIPLDVFNAVQQLMKIRTKFITVPKSFHQCSILHRLW
ncbi:MAG TPA: recombinase family protein [Metabacillus sp.]|nr:recombinase family protein [Metabacillus sp.]